MNIYHSRIKRLQGKASALYIILLLSIVVLIPVERVSAYAAYVSGPTGYQDNGYFYNDAVIGFAIATGDSPPPGVTATVQFSVKERVGLAIAEGMHTYRFYNQHQFDTSAGGLCFTIDDGAKNCFSNTGTDNSPKGLFYTKEIGFDSKNPDVRISYPTNNTNTSSKQVKVVGFASDKGSGIDYVKVNGVQATLSGDSWEAMVPLANGLNTIYAAGYDKSGKSSTSNNVTVFAQYSTAPSQATSTAPKVSQATNPSSQNNAVQQSSQASPSSLDDQNKPAADTKNTIVATEVQAKSASNFTSQAPIIIGVLLGLAILVTIMVKLGLIQIHSGKIKDIFRKHK